MTLETTLFANEHAAFKPEVVGPDWTDLDLEAFGGPIRRGLDDHQQDLIALERTPDQDIGRNIFKPGRRDELEHLMAQRRFPVAGRCIELGSGPGWLAQMLTRYPQVTEVVALDISARSILRWSPALADRIQPDAAKLKYLVRDMNRFEEDEGHFDTAVFAGSLHHSSDIPRSLATANRLLRPGGMVVLFAEHYYPVIGLQQRRLRRVRRERPDLLFTIPEFSRALSRAGFEAHVLRYCLTGKAGGRRGLKNLAKRAVSRMMPWLIGYVQLADYMMIGLKVGSPERGPGRLKEESPR
jgi:SAM-dependent methyltransferase